MNDEIKLQFIINLSGKEGNHKAPLFLFLLTLSLKKTCKCLFVTFNMPFPTVCVHYRILMSYGLLVTPRC